MSKTPQDNQKNPVFSASDLAELNDSVRVSAELLARTAGESREQIYPTTQIRKITGAYVCSQCWSGLRVKDIMGERGMVLIYCPVCGPGYGFHSKHYMERRTQESQYERKEAEQNLAGLLRGTSRPEPKETDVNQILKDIGF